MRDLLKITITATCVLALALSAVPANAGPRGGAMGKRDIITDTYDICNSPFEQLLIDACDILDDTAGTQDTINSYGVNCFEEFDAFDDIMEDTGTLIYVGRNCDKNEEALLRKISSAILSIEDFLASKSQQAQTAVDYLCVYVSKIRELAGVSKVIEDVPDGYDSLADRAVELSNDIDDVSDVVTEACF
jgi:hypothetical protein